MLRINEVLRAQNVKRWSLISTTRPQSVAEHTFNVTMIARSIMSKAGELDLRIMKACIEHDLDEVITGDIPSPTKRKMEETGFDFDSIEGVKKNVDQLDRDELLILKVADLTDAVHFLSEFGTGRRAADIEELLRNQLEEVIESLPVVLANQVFLEPIIDTVDEVLLGDA